MSLIIPVFLGACAEEDPHFRAAAAGVTTPDGDVAASEEAVWEWSLHPAGGFAPSGTPSAVDADGDGYPADVDCDDGDPRESPDPRNIDFVNDGVDQDCVNGPAYAPVPNTQFVVEGGWSLVVARCDDKVLEVPLNENGYGLLVGVDPESCADFVVNVGVRLAAGDPAVNTEAAALGVAPDLFVWVLPGAPTDLGYGIAEPLTIDPLGSYWAGDEVPWVGGWPYGYP
ncbi:MAG: hypothetical protein KIH62_000630 [Candidatus Kerfeldbacteria bacterium]|nr:hypothetical protein [Candidatus Kerfeldbacteria bacterium]